MRQPGQLSRFDSFTDEEVRLLHTQMEPAAHWSKDAGEIMAELDETIADRKENRSTLYLCAQCGYEWRGNRETHAPDCPNRKEMQAKAALPS